MKKALALAAAVGFLAAAGGLPVMPGGGGRSSSAAPDFSLEVDTGPVGNTNDALGPTETCLQVNAGESFLVDIVAKEAPPLFGVEISILYDPQVLRVKSVQVDGGLFLGKIPGSNVTNFSYARNDGDYRAAAADMSITGPSGSGTVFRLTLEATGAGASLLQIPTDDPATFFNEGPVVPDTHNNPLSPALAGGEVRVGQQEPCAAGTSPPAPVRPSDLPASPEPEPTDDATPEPGASATPGTIGQTPQATATATPDEPETAPEKASKDEDSGSDLTKMPWLALWVALGGLGLGGGGGALLRLLLRRMR